MRAARASAPRTPPQGGTAAGLRTRRRISAMADAPALDARSRNGVEIIRAARAGEGLLTTSRLRRPRIRYQGTADLRFPRKTPIASAGATSFAFRVIPKTVPKLEQLNMPARRAAVAESMRLDLLSHRATGSGKDDDARGDDPLTEPHPKAAISRIETRSRSHPTAMHRHHAKVGYSKPSSFGPGPGVRSARIPTRF